MWSDPIRAKDLPSEHKLAIVLIEYPTSDRFGLVTAHDGNEYFAARDGTGAVRPVPILERIKVRSSYGAGLTPEAVIEVVARIYGRGYTHFTYSPDLSRPDTRCWPIEPPDELKDGPSLNNNPAADPAFNKEV